MRRWIAPFITFTIVLLLCPQTWAASPTEQLRGFFAAATRILADPRQEARPDEQLSAIRMIVGDMFDFRETAQLSLGPEWSARTPAERVEFVRLFADLVERSFIIAIAARIRLADGVQVSYLGESIDGALATVRTAILGKSGLELPFSYRMIERGGRWAVRDVVIDGVSLAANYRAQFVRVIQASSYGDLIRQMRARVPGMPTATLMTTAVEDAHPIALITSAPPTEMARTEPPEATLRQAPPPAHDRATGQPAAQGQQSKAVPIALIQLETTAVPPKSAVKNDAAIEAPGPAAAPREPRPQRQQARAGAMTGPTSAVARSARSYWVQVGAFANPDTARRLASLLREQEPSVSPHRWVVVGAVAAPGPPVACVRVGPFPDRPEAASKLRELQARGYQPFITEERD